MAGKELRSDPEEMGKPLCEMRNGFGLRGIPQGVGCPFLLTLRQAQGSGQAVRGNRKIDKSLNFN
jgi:lysozyme family protein